MTPLKFEILEAGLDDYRVVMRDGDKELQVIADIPWIKVNLWRALVTILNANDIRL